MNSAGSMLLVVSVTVEAIGSQVGGLMQLLGCKTGLIGNQPKTPHSPPRPERRLGDVDTDVKVCLGDVLALLSRGSWWDPHLIVSTECPGAVT